MLLAEHHPPRHRCRVLESDSGAFAGEITRPIVRRPRAPWLGRLGAAVWTGIKAGTLPAAAVGAIYYLANRDQPMPWQRIALVLAAFGPITGVSLALAIEGLVMLCDAFAALWRPLGWIANPVTAGVVGGGLAGIGPGAIGVSVFGSYHGPFVGTGLLSAAVITGALMTAVPLARRARRLRWQRDNDRVIAFATLFATLILCAVAAVIAPVIVEVAFVEIRGAVEEFGVAVGAVVGAFGGAVAGFYIGLVIALGRSLRGK